MYSISPAAAPCLSPKAWLCLGASLVLRTSFLLFVNLPKAA